VTQSCAKIAQTVLQSYLSPETISAYVHHLLPAEEQQQVEAHLQHCNTCLAETQQAHRYTTLLATSERRLVPDSLKKQVVAMWQTSQTWQTSPAASCSRLVIQIVQTGLQLIEKELVAPLRDVQSSLTPLPTYRTDQAAAPLSLHIETGHTAIKAIVSKEGEGVALRLTLLSAEQEGLSMQRIFLRQQGRSLFSAKTDREGTLRMPHLDPGTYEVACPGVPAAFQLELRS
jgi:hypothetical protein